MFLFENTDKLVRQTSMTFIHSKVVLIKIRHVCIVSLPTNDLIKGIHRSERSFSSVVWFQIGWIDPLFHFRLFTRKRANKYACWISFFMNWTEARRKSNMIGAMITMRVPHCLRGIAPKPRPATAGRCSIDLTDLADFPTGDTYIWVENNLKVSAQTDVPFGRYGSCK